MCITIPGLFNLEGADLIDVPEKRSVYGSVISHDVTASSTFSENYHYELERHPWLPVFQVDAVQTYAWLQRVLPRFSMLADNPASKAVLALLYLCKGDAYSGAGAAWLFNGLEALFQCGPGEIEQY